MSLIVELDEVTHTYRAGGAVVPGVTSILGSLRDFTRIDEEVLRKACERGTNVHLATEYHDRGTLDETSLLPEEAGYLEGWKKFCAEHKPWWLSIEEIVFHPVHRYAGKLDRRCSMQFGGQRIEVAQVDVKTGATHPVMGLQLAAYVAAAGDPPSTPRFTCQLNKNGTYKLVQWTDPTDWPMFLSLLNINSFRRKHGI